MFLLVVTIASSTTNGLSNKKFSQLALVKLFAALAD